MSNDLRLRLMLALGWQFVMAWDSVTGAHYEDWTMPDCNPWIFGTDDTGAMDYTAPSLPQWGTWASCEEIDAKIKEQNWEWSSVMTRHGIKVEIDLPHGKLGARCWDGLGTATAPTFPEAFCQAVEAHPVNGRNPSQE